MNLETQKSLLPSYPRTPHLPYHPQPEDGDVVALDKDAASLFTIDAIYVEEKVDGANCGMMLFEDNPIIRNRDHILKKGYLKETPAKQQFRPLWNWFYDNKTKFEKLNSEFGRPVGVYGEWLFAVHGIIYDQLPSHFLAFDIYDPEARSYLDTASTRRLLEKTGFPLVPLLKKGKIESYEELELFCKEPSTFSTEKREGVYIKQSDGETITKRFKMLRPDYKQGFRWNQDKLNKQVLQFPILFADQK